jgi:hypothetical protein
LADLSEKLRALETPSDLEAVVILGLVVDGHDTGDAGGHIAPIAHFLNGSVAVDPFEALVGVGFRAMALVAMPIRMKAPRIVIAPAL